MNIDDLPIGGGTTIATDKSSMNEFEQGAAGPGGNSG